MLLPPQKLSKAEKEARHEKSGKNNIEETADYYIANCNWNSHIQEIAGLYAAVEGYLVQEDYQMIQNPHNKQKPDEAPLQYNALLKNYNILKGIANLLMGEFGRRAHEYQVTSIAPSDEMSYKDGLNVLIRNYYAQAVANNLMELGFDVGQKVQDLPTIEEYTQGYKDKFDETRVVSGQEVLDYVRFNCDLDSKYLDLYWDWIVTGGCFTFKEVNHDDINFEVVPRHELFIPNERHSRYAEDYSFAVRRQVLPIFKVIDKFRGRIPEELIDALEAKAISGLEYQFSDVQMTGRNGALRLPTLHITSMGSMGQNYATTSGVELYHVVYKTFRKYGELTYLNELGFESKMEVDDTYILNKEQGDIKLEWKWENTTYQVYKCLDMYLDAGELKENRADLNQAGLQKLPYNGIQERSSTGEIQSIIKEGLPYQRLVNVLHFQVEKLINKNKDKLTVMPYGLVPRKKGIDTKTQMYHADATSILWIDETAPNAQFAAQMIKVLDMSLGAYIKDTISLIQYIKQEYWDAIGMNGQRYADVDASAGKAVTEQAIIRSAIITYELTRQFEKLIEKDYQGLLDISKLAYINGKKAKYVRSDGSRAFLDMNQDNARYHSEASYNVFVMDSSLLTEAIQAVRGQAVNLIQNGGDMSVVGHLFSTNSVAKLTKILEKLEANKREYEQMLQQQQAEANQALQDSKNANDEANRQVKYYEADKAYQAAVDSASIRSDANNSRNEPRPANEVEQRLADHKVEVDNRELALKEEATRSKAETDRLNAKNKNKNNTN